MNLRRGVLTALFFLPILTGMAEVRLNPIFTDHMVLQRNQVVPIYGTADPDTEITVDFAGQVKTATTDANGYWRVDLDPMPAFADSRTLEVYSQVLNFKFQVSDILLGDVWLCAGQSNMATEMKLYPTLRGEKADAMENPLVRLFKIKREGIPKPEPSSEVVIDPAFKGSWQKMTPDFAREFSAVGIFFGHALQPKLGVPVGLLYANRGGTTVNQWLPMDFMKSKPDLYAPFLGPDNPWWTESKRNPGLVRAPSRLFNGTINPVIPFAIRGCIWYQGESDAHYSDIYGEMISDLITVWRGLWGYDFDFLFVQLAPFEALGWDARGEAWAFQREAQDAALALPKTARAVIIDSGEQLDIHPQNKQPVGERLALLAAHLDKPEIAAHSPEFGSAVVTGNKIHITFKHAGFGLETRRMAMNKNKRMQPGTDPEAFVVEADTLAGFIICGADKKFVKAQAKILSSDTVAVWADEIEEPIAVRYGWANFPLCNLYNRAGLPACPFRSDNFPMPDFAVSGLSDSAAEIQTVKLEVRDDFSSSLSRKWCNEHPTTWSVQDGELWAGMASSSHYTLTHSDAVADGERKIDLSATISSGSRSAWGGIAFNIQDAENFYILRIKFDNGMYQLVRLAGSAKPLVVDTETLATPFALNTQYTLRLQFSPKDRFYVVTITDAATGEELIHRSKVEAAPMFVSGLAGLYGGSKSGKANLFVFDDFVFKAGE